MNFGRWIMLCMLSVSLWIPPVPALSQGAKPQDVLPFQHVVQTAKDLADKPFQNIPEEKTPELLREIGYDQWRDIRFKSPYALWANDNLFFQAQFFLPSFLYQQPVKIHIVDPTGARPFEFSRDYFEYGKTGLAEKVPEDLGYAGFRLHYPLRTRSYYDEFVVFLGASYFRAVAQNQGYGLSARGLAIDTAVPSGEEFPVFKEFWILKPGPSDYHITVYALLDSPSVAGAYRMTIRPSSATAMDVECVLFPRKEIAKLGIAPASSMFFFGEHSSRETGKDFRPEVHDSDGLLVVNGEEWIWRPLVNPRHLFINTFETDSLKGFGIVQRDTDFDHYQDLESHFERRPSLWVTPQGNWGRGRVELVQIPTVNEFNDNIAVFWVPGEKPKSLEPLHYKYTLTWYTPPHEHPAGLAAVRSTRKMKVADKAFRFVIEFDGGELSSTSNMKDLTADIWVEEGYEIADHQLQKNPATGGWRLTFQTRPVEDETFLEKVLPEKEDVVEIRAMIKINDRRLTEVWSYAIHP